MKSKYLVWTVFFLLINLKIFGQTGEIQGFVLDRNEGKGLVGANVRIINTKIETITDLKGKFKITNIPIGTYDLSVSYISYGDTTIKELKILSDTILQFKLELPPPCIYDKHRKNKTCPICSKRNKVVPIVYGLPIGKLDEKNYHYAGCVITLCDPTWYCKRDNHKF